jgi:two-component system phosphate regulon sensor histidine kinase PhoR
MLGRPLWEQVRQEALQRVVRQAAVDGGMPRVEFDVARTQSTVGVTASRLPGNPAPGVVVVMHDVTELRRLENLRRDFVQNVSHELKTPLSSIAAYADTLLEGGLEDAASNRLFVERIAEQADRLHRLILDLLALAKMEAGEEAYDVEPTDVSRIATACIDAHQGVARAKRIELVTEAPTGAIWGYADDDGLRTILDNLLDNAVNYTPENGRIVVRWSREGSRVLIQVRDTGPGIAHEHQQRIFQRFYRIDKARSRELGGTGLGLSIVKHLCQLFGGTISVQSQLGQGSTFIVELRAAA